MAAVLATVVGISLVVGHVLHEPRRQVATSMQDYSDVCEARPIPGAAQYAPGAGPHPVVVFGSDRDDFDSTPVQVRFGDADALYDPATFDPEDPPVVQLVACAEIADEGERVTSCQFKHSGSPLSVHGGPTVEAPLLRATIEITVYEARTAGQVGASVVVEGQSLDCPTGATSYHGTVPTIYSAPTKIQYLQVLYPFVR